MDRHLRVVGAGLDAQVPAAGSGDERIAGEARELGEQRRLLASDPEPIHTVIRREECRAEPEGDGQRARGQVERFACVVRRGERGAVDGSGFRDVLTLRHAGRGKRPVLQQLNEVIAGRRV